MLFQRKKVRNQWNITRWTKNYLKTITNARWSTHTTNSNTIMTLPSYFIIWYVSKIATCKNVWHCIYFYSSIDADYLDELLSSLSNSVPLQWACPDSWDGIAASTVRTECRPACPGRNSTRVEFSGPGQKGVVQICDVAHDWRQARPCKGSLRYGTIPLMLNLVIDWRKCSSSIEFRMKRNYTEHPSTYHEIFMHKFKVAWHVYDVDVRVRRSIIIKYLHSIKPVNSQCY